MPTTLQSSFPFRRFVQAHCRAPLLRRGRFLTLAGHALSTTLNHKPSSDLDPPTLRQRRRHRPSTCAKHPAPLSILSKSSDFITADSTNSTAPVTTSTPQDIIKHAASSVPASKYLLTCISLSVPTACITVLISAEIVMRLKLGCGYQGGWTHNHGQLCGY